MGDNQKEAPASNFDLTGDGSTMYDSDSQIRTAIIRRLLNEYRTTNYFLVNAMQSTFLRFFIPDSYSVPPEYNRPKSDSDYYKPKNNDHIKIEELNIKLNQLNECCFDNMSKLNERNCDTFRSEFDTLSTTNSREENESELVTGRTCYSTEKDFQFVDVDDYNNDEQQFEDDKPSSFASMDSLEDERQFYPQWKKINKGKDKIQHSAHSSRRGEKPISCSFNDSNRSSIDKCSDRNDTSCNKGKCKPEFIPKGITDKTSNNNNNNSNNNNNNNNKVKNENTNKIPQRRENKWQVFCELYEELNSPLKNQNSTSSSTESIRSSVKNCDTSHSSLERKINDAIKKLKDKKSDANKLTKMIKNTENLKVKFNTRFTQPKTEEDTSSDTDEVLVRNRYLRNKRIYNTKKYITNKFRKTVRKRKNQIELLSTTTTTTTTGSSSDDSDYYTTQTKPPLNTSPIQDFQHKCAENSFRMKQFQQKCVEPSQKTSQQQFEGFQKMLQPHLQSKCFHNLPRPPQQQCCHPESYHKMNDKLIHETIFENSEEEPPYPHPPFPSYFQKFMDKYELLHKKGCTNIAAKCYQESGTLTSCDDYSNFNETSCVRRNNSNASIDNNGNNNDKNSGQSTSSSLDSINEKSGHAPCTVTSASNTEEDTHRNYPKDLTKTSASTICLKPSNMDSGLGASVSEIKPIENVFIIKKPNRNENYDDIVIDNSALQWTKICKGKVAVSKLPFAFSSSSKSKSSTDNEERIKNKPKMRVIFKREATVIDLFNPASREKTPVLKLNQNNCLDLRKKKWFCCFRDCVSCCYR